MSNRKVSSDWIHRLEKPDHWMSYWYQLSMLENKLDSDDKIVELGIGSKFIYNYLKNKGFQIVGVDVDSGKNPDIVCDAVNYFPDSLIDHFLAFEVFEHLEYLEMEMVLEHISEKVNKNIFISLPRNIRSGLSVQLKIKSFRKNIVIPISKGKITNPYHYWELGYKDYNESKLIKTFDKYGFALKNKLYYLHWVYFQFSINA